MHHTYLQKDFKVIPISREKTPGLISPFGTKELINIAIYDSIIVRTIPGVYLFTKFIYFTAPFSYYYIIDYIGIMV